MTQETKTCQNCKVSFVVEPEDFQFYEKIKVPPPTFCPTCRFQRRMAYRNERALYKRKCDLCGEMKVSYFSLAAPCVVYCPPCWWSDKWDALAFGREYDFSRPFFKQFVELRSKVPQAGLATQYETMVNSDYCHMAGELKNCYLVTHSNDDDNCFYSSALYSSKDCGEMLSCQECELCLEDVHCAKCHRTYFSLDCESCHNVAFSRNCVGCSYCFGCVNLRNKQYYIFNEPYSKEEYFKKLDDLDIGSYRMVETLHGKTKQFRQQFPQKYIHGRHNTNASGDYIYHSKNVSSCYDVVYVEDSKYCQYLAVKASAQCYDYTEWGDNTELAYESINCGKGFVRSRFGQQSWNEVHDADYTSHCITSSNLFGCVSLRHKEYCILNKQYSKNDYFALREKIIAHMNTFPYVDKKGRAYRYGEFFPIELSFWSYNETTANEYFPLSEEETKSEGYSWTDIEKHKGKYQSTMQAKSIPDHIRDVPDSILNQIIACSACSKSYRFTNQEFSFYKSQHIALPRKCYDCRYMDRFHERNSFRLYPRQCDCGGAESKNEVYANATSHFHGTDHCPNKFETSYAPERPEIVYCEQCYQAEVV